MERIVDFLEKYGTVIPPISFDSPEKENISRDVTDLLEKASSLADEEKYMTLEALKTLCRDRLVATSLSSREVLSTLVSMIPVVPSGEKEGRAVEGYSSERVSVAALKCLYNMTLCNPVCVERGMRSLPLFDNLMINLPKKNGDTSSSDVQVFSLRVCVLATSCWRDYRSTMAESDAFLGVLVENLNHLCKVSKVFSDAEATVCGEILKILFNATLSADTEDAECLLPALKTAAKISYKLLKKPHTSCPDQALLIQRHAIGLLINLQPTLVGLLDKTQGEGKRHIAIATALLDYLERALALESGKCKEFLLPVCTLCTGLARTVRAFRKYMRLKILPPLKDEVKMLPTEGDALRNKLCSWMTSPAKDMSEIVTLFLYILCKENIDRLVKYTGMGNAAGFLANHGLFGKSGTGQWPEQKPCYSSDSDSDTEEYNELARRVNPVTGRVEEDRGDNPLAHLTEEQKEEQVMGLVNQYQRMLDAGIVKPARVGEDGRIVPLEHVTQLLADVEQGTNSDDSDD